ncbi:hypothetical protein JJV70_10670 [Streptomyces sp. JJ66]|uniref:hypothetical protein n=1 Tax=Streptomyces sp. JJ66 TaxID=2803843 RepID=UPI001C5778C1|nr:hypothetical protein [Streptomyces sp. JJ66]MBW1602560.1 hypothetical protein [Streptomyces sp. JJ66]
MKRGHVYRIRYQDRSIDVLVVSDDQINAHVGGATVVQVYPQGERTPTLLSVPMETPLPGFAVTDRYSSFSAAHFTDDRGPVDARVMEAVEISIRTVLGL